MSEGLFYSGLQTMECPSAGPASANDSTARNVVGTVMRHNGAFWRYVKFDNGQGNVASAAGGVAHWKTLTFPTSTVAGVFTVTSDQTDAIAGKNSVAGVFGGVITDLYFGFVQISGKCTAKTAASTVAGDMCIGSTVDLTFGRVAEGANVTDVVYAVAYDTRNDTAGTNTVLLQNLLW